MIGGADGLVFGVLVFVIGLLVVVNAWAVVDAKLAATAAAREATRTFVESASGSTDVALGEASAAAGAAIVAHGRSLDRFELEAGPGVVLARCARVEFAARYRVPLVSVPLLGRIGSGFEVVGRHSEVVDPYRSGVPDDGRCP